MRTMSLPSIGFAAAIVALLPAVPAYAQSVAFVSGTGTGNACTRVAPCNNFLTAMSVVGDGGVVVCVDAINDITGIIFSQSVTIDCTGTYAGIGGFMFTGGNGQKVVLRGLTFEGRGVNLRGLFQSGNSSVHIENCRITGYRGVGGSNPGNGILLTPGSGETSYLFLTDVAIEENGLAASGGGVLIQPTGSGSARVSIERTIIAKNTHGIVADGTGTTGFVIVQVNDSRIAANAGNGIWVKGAGVVIDHTTSKNNAGYGILSDGSGSLVHLGASTVAGNGGGLGSPGGGQIFSYQNNQLKGNGIDGAPTGVLSLQ